MADQKLPDDEPISMDDDSSAAPSQSAVKAFGAVRIQAATDFKRPLNADGSGATRVKIFHSKIAGPSLEYMENQINQWIDSDKIEIKSVGQVIGTLEGKTPVPNVIVFVWY